MSLQEPLPELFSGLPYSSVPLIPPNPGTLQFTPLLTKNTSIASPFVHPRPENSSFLFLLISTPHPTKKKTLCFSIILFERRMKSVVIKLSEFDTIVFCLLFLNKYKHCLFQQVIYSLCSIKESFKFQEFGERRKTVLWTLIILWWVLGAVLRLEAKFSRFLLYWQHSMSCFVLTKGRCTSRLAQGHTHGALTPDTNLWNISL